MKIGLTGATGFVGRHFLAVARSAGHDVIGFSRTPQPHPGFVEMRPWHPVRGADFSGLGAIVHLAGENLVGWWTRRKKDAIRRSRVIDTCDLITRLRELPGPPRVLVCANGTAWYGDGGEAKLPESAPHGSGFLAEVARAWEDAAMEGADITRVVTMRTGMVLGADGGAAPVLRRVFRLGVGGRLGGGWQWMPWIHVTDLARLYLWAVETETVRGPVNAVAPELVRNSDFTRVVAQTLHRHAFWPVPAYVLRMLPGGMSEIFLNSQRTMPAAALAGGFSFLFPGIADAVQDTFLERKKE